MYDINGNLIYTRSNSGQSRLLRPSVLHVLGALRRSLRLGSAWLGAWLSACQSMNGGPQLVVCQAAILQCGLEHLHAALQKQTCNNNDYTNPCLVTWSGQFRSMIQTLVRFTHCM